MRPLPRQSDRLVYLLLDVSPSMDLVLPSKLEVAQHLTGALAYVAASRMDRVQVTTFYNRI